MQVDPFEQVRTVLSSNRLDLGFRANTSEAESSILARCLHNLALCEALYPVLHHLEVALRNRLDAVISAHYPASVAAPAGPDGLPVAGCWLDATPGLLGTWERTEIQRVKKKLRSAGKRITPDRLIAGLSLGFWANLFTRAYEIGPASSYSVGSATHTALWPRHLRAVFPHLPRRFATRDHAYRTLRSIADLRNQVFHHRPIWRMRLNALHVVATDALGWISPDLKELTIAMDRFPHVVAAGTATHEQTLSDFVSKRS